MIGSNVLPSTILNANEAPIFCSSSSLKYVSMVLRLGFDLLDEMHRQRSAGRSLFGGKTRRAIVEGDFRLGRVQWAGYLPTPNRKGLLQVLAAMYEQTISDGVSVINLASYLGLECLRYSAHPGVGLAGCYLFKRHGETEAFTLCFYDKRRRLAQKKQLRWLSESDLAIVEGHIRFDLTAHAPGLLSMIGHARAKVKECAALRHKLEGRFLEEEPKATAWWVERAVWALSVRAQGGRVVRRSLAGWLAPHALEDIARLPQLSRCGRERFNALMKLKHRVAHAWRATTAIEGPIGSARLASASGASKATVYRWRERWLAEYDIDIFVPCALYRDLLFFGPNTFTDAPSRASVLQAVEAGDGRELLDRRLGGEAAFEQARRQYLRPALEGEPLRMPMALPEASSLAGWPKPSRAGRPTVSTLFDAERRRALHRRP